MHAALLALAVLSQAPQWVIPPVFNGGQLSNGSNGMWGACMASDAVPPAWYIEPPDAYPAATVNKTGSNLYLAGSAATKTITFSAANPQTTCPTANSGGATTIVITTSPSGSATTYTFGTGWCVSGCTTATLAASAFATYLTANPPTNGTGITAVNAAGVVQLTLPGTVQSLSTTFNGATCGSASNGTDGAVGISSSTGATFITAQNAASFLFGQSPGATNSDIHARYGYLGSGLYVTQNDASGTFGANIAVPTKGANVTLASVQQTLTFPGGGAATEVTTGPLVPAGAVMLGYSARVIVAGATCTSWEMGDGTTATRFCPSGTALTQGTTCTAANSATAGALPDWAASGTGRNFTITSVGSNCTNLSVRVTATFLQSFADTAN